MDEEDIALLKTYVSNHIYFLILPITNSNWWYYQYYNGTNIPFLNLQGQGQWTINVKAVEDDIESIIKRINELTGIKESDTGLAPPAFWDLTADKQTLQNEQPLQVDRILIFLCKFNNEKY